MVSAITIRISQANLTSMFFLCSLIIYYMQIVQHNYCGYRMPTNLVYAV
jgi:hypothetical protein